MKKVYIVSNAANDRNVTVTAENERDAAEKGVAEMCNHGDDGVFDGELTSVSVVNFTDDSQVPSYWEVYTILSTRWFAIASAVSSR